MRLVYLPKMPRYKIMDAPYLTVAAEHPLAKHAAMIASPTRKKYEL
jgi:hypothetical protein